MHQDPCTLSASFDLCRFSESSLIEHHFAAVSHTQDEFCPLSATFSFLDQHHRLKKAYVFAMLNSTFIIYMKKKLVLNGGLSGKRFAGGFF